MEKLIELANLLAEVRRLTLAQTNDQNRSLDDLTTRMGLLLLEAGSEVSQLKVALAALGQTVPTTGD